MIDVIKNDDGIMNFFFPIGMKICTHTWYLIDDFPEDIQEVHAQISNFSSETKLKIAHFSIGNLNRYKSAEI